MISSFLTLQVSSRVPPHRIVVVIAGKNKIRKSVAGIIHICIYTEYRISHKAVPYNSPLDDYVPISPT